MYIYYDDIDSMFLVSAFAVLVLPLLILDMLNNLKSTKKCKVLDEKGAAYVILLRITNDDSRYSFAKKLGVTETEVRRWEECKSYPDEVALKVMELLILQEIGGGHFKSSPFTHKEVEFSWWERLFR